MFNDWIFTITPSKKTFLTFARTVITWRNFSIAPKPRAVVSSVSSRGIGAGSCSVPRTLPTGLIALWPAGPISVAAIIWEKRVTDIQSGNSSLIDKVKNKIKCSNLRGQEMRLQTLDSIAGPRPTAAQSRPPLVGAGLLQVLYLCVRPPPHVTSQSDQSLHIEYPPSSANEIKVFGGELPKRKKGTSVINERVGVLFCVVFLSVCDVLRYLSRCVF